MFLFLIQLLQPQYIKIMQTPFFSLFVFFCVNTHIIENRFSDSIPMEELVEAGILFLHHHYELLQTLQT